jgi:aminoglycoside phosphotransferase family enzyme
MTVVQHDFAALRAGEPTLADKVAFLASPTSYRERVASVTCRETHMSWVFLTEDKVYKLKKPVRFPYLDFSTLARRETACRAEISLNRRLAPDVYLCVEPLVATSSGLSIGGEGEVVDWLVVMRRLDERWALDRMIEDERVKRRQLARVVHVLGHFYRHAQRAFVSAAAQRAEWRRNIYADCRVLLDDRFGLPSAPVRSVMHAQLRFLDERAECLATRVAARRIVDGHGDLRPEHIWLSDGVKIIDCLEFNARLRTVDPADELAYLSLECERLGARWVGDEIERGVLRMLHDDPGQELLLFYRCHRAMLRARLAVAHLSEPAPRTPEKWTPRALAYLAIARRDAERLNRLLSRPEGR